MKQGQISQQLPLVATVNHGVAPGGCQSQHICLQPFCATGGGSTVGGGVDIQQLKLQQHGKTSQQSYLQQQELLQQAQSLQCQLQQAQQLHHLMQQKGAGGTVAMGGGGQHSISTSAQQELLTQQFQQQLIQAQQLHQFNQKQAAGVHAHVLQTPPGVLPFTAAACAGGAHQGTPLKGVIGGQQSVKGIVPAPFHFSPQLPVQSQLLVGQQGICAPLVPSYDIGGGYPGAMTPTSSSAPLSPNASPASPQLLPPVYPPSIEVRLSLLVYFCYAAVLGLNIQNHRFKF